MRIAPAIIVRAERDKKIDEIIVRAERDKKLKICIVLEIVNWISKNQYDELMLDVEEMYRILTASIKTAKSKLK